MDEFDFIRSIQQRNYRQSTLIKGVGDDAAVFRPAYQDTVVAVDTFVEGVHFADYTMRPFHVGYRALAANISDMAAMRAKPVFYLVSITVPPKWNEQQLSEIYRGMETIGSAFQMDLIGGDTVSGKELSVSVTVIGYVNRGGASYRSHSKEQDVVFVTGSLGDSQAGLHLLTHPELNIIEDKDYFITRHRMPSPRVNFVKELEGISRIALNDISDGIGNEAAEIAEASQVTLHLKEELLPTKPEFKKFTKDQQRQWKLFGGEDFELVGTVPQKDWPKVVKAAERAATPLTKIGSVVNNPVTNGKVVLEQGTKKEILDKSGYTHMK